MSSLGTTSTISLCILQKRYGIFDGIIASTGVAFTAQLHSPHSEEEDEGGWLDDVDVEDVKVVFAAAADGLGFGAAAGLAFLDEVGAAAAAGLVFGAAAGLVVGAAAAGLGFLDGGTTTLFRGVCLVGWWADIIKG